MADIGSDYGDSRKITMCWQARRGGRVINATLFSALVCLAVSLQSGRVNAADPASISSDSVQPQSYQQEVAEEAGELISRGVAEEETTSMPMTEGSESGAAINQERLNQINSAVRGALGEPWPDASPVVDRKQRIRELVVETPVPDPEQEDTYLGELRDEVSQTKVVEEPRATPAQASSAASETAPSAVPKDYRVQPGDSLWKISVALFGDGSRWKAIYNANRRSLPNCERLAVGQQLTIPND